MNDLKGIYVELISKRAFMQKTKAALIEEWKKQAIEIGYPEIVLDFFLDMKGYDLSEETLRKAYQSVREYFMSQGEWISTGEAKNTGIWKKAKQNIRQNEEFL